MTSPTTGREQPSRSILVIRRGSTDSDEEVPSTIRISSPMYLRNLNRLKPTSAAIGAEDDEDEQRAGEVDAAISLPSATQRRDAVAADREGHRAEGAKRREPHDEATISNSTFDTIANRSTSGPPASPRRAAPGRRAPRRAGPAESRRR